MSKFYAVKCDENAVFGDWESCKAYAEGKKSYKIKSFSTEEEARAFLSGKDLYEENLKNDLANGYAVAYTDGSFEEGKNEYSYGVVAVAPNGTKSEFCGKGSEKDFLASRNIAGETLGAITAVKWAAINGYKKLKLYHDYAGLSKWASGEWAAKSPVSLNYKDEMGKYSGCVDVEFVKVKGHSNDKYNEEVDSLAKAALFDGKNLQPCGKIFKVYGSDAFDYLVGYVLKQAQKARYERKDDEIGIYTESERLFVRSYGYFTVVAGDCERLFAIAVTGAILHDKRLIKTFLERAYDVAVDENIGSLLSATRYLTERYQTEEYGKFLFFALAEISEYVKTVLAERDIKYEKILELFDKKDGWYSFKEEYGNDAELKKAERAFNLFYEYRTEYFTKNRDREETLAITDKIEDALRS